MVIQTFVRKRLEKSESIKKRSSFVPGAVWDCVGKQNVRNLMLKWNFKEFY